VRWICTLLMVVISTPAWGQFDPQDRFELTARQVVQALSEKGINVSEQQVSLLAEVVASEPNPHLDILKVESAGGFRLGKDSGSQSWFRVACHEPGTCLPFYAAVSRTGATNVLATGAFPAPPAARQPALKPIHAVTMRVGAHAMLVMDDNRAHIQIAVISLENGVAGHEIRVASPDHKQVYVAEVVSAHMLKGSF
jgi:hypothetical protein